jgi:hypothetical protein
MSDAKLQVISTTELLEGILANLELKTLLISAQRVCKSWHELITTSKPIQQALYFAPIEAKSASEVTEKRTINPLLKEIFSPFFEGTERNPIMASKDVFGFMNGSSKTKMTGHTLIQEDTTRNSFLREGASWRRMLVQQPAAPKIGYIESRGMYERNFYNAVVDAPDGGVRMGLLYDMVYRFMGLNMVTGGFSICWRAPADAPTEYVESNGLVDIIIRRYTDDVGIIILRNARGIRYIGAAETVGELDATYRPEEFELQNMQLKFAYGEDWFG